MNSSAFCSTPLWDPAVTWFTDNPDFTPCFHATILASVPTAFLLLFTPLQLYHASTSTDRGVPWSYVNVTRVILTGLLILLTVVDLCYEAATPDYFGPEFAVGSAVRALGYIGALTLQIFIKKKGKVTSGTLTVFWLLSALCDSFTFRTVIQGEEKLLPAILFLIEYPLVIAALFTICFADPEPTYKNLEGEQQ